MTRWFNVRALYQIYPRSFYDTNADGVGDIPGIIEKLDYLKGSSTELGVDAIWLSPFYPSPMADFGYDISDYKNVHPLFGTLADFDHLIDESHQRDIKVMIDFVPNHTSDAHLWFQLSRSSRENEYRDWYTWRDPAPDGGPPNNWLSVFGGSAWELDPITGQYYLHSFLTKQPDLNWANPKVRAAMADVLRFWLDRGVDGFRVDAVRWLSKDQSFADNPLNPNYTDDGDPYHSQLQLNSRYGSELYTYLQEIVDVVEQYPDAIIVCEDYPDADADHVEQYVDFYEHLNPDIAAPLNYDGLRIPYNAAQLNDFVTKFQAALLDNYLPVYSFGNHDKPRLASRVTRDQALLIAVMQLTLPGLPVLYYGDEIGMQDVVITADQVQDPFEKQLPGVGLGRDPERTPMQWSTAPNAGFSHGKPWLPIADDADQFNVDEELKDKDSFLNLYRHLLHLRSVSGALLHGTYELLPESNSQLFCYVREHKGERMRVILNLSDDPLSYPVVGWHLVFLSTNPSRLPGEIHESVIELAPNEALIVR